MSDLKAKIHKIRHPRPAQIFWPRTAADLTTLGKIDTGRADGDMSVSWLESGRTQHERLKFHCTLLHNYSITTQLITSSLSPPNNTTTINCRRWTRATRYITCVVL